MFRQINRKKLTYFVPPFRRRKAEFIHIYRPVRSDPRQKADSPRLLSRPDMRGEARKKYTSSSLNDQRNSTRQKSSKQHRKTEDYWSLPHFYILPRKNSFFAELGFGLTMQKIRTYSFRL